MCISAQRGGSGADQEVEYWGLCMTLCIAALEAFRTVVQAAVRVSHGRVGCASWLCHK